MSENDNNKILNITYIAKNAIWFHKILQTMNTIQKLRYNKTILPSLSIIISRKLSLIQVLKDQINLEMKEINKILKENIKEVENCINKNYTFSFGREVYLIYRIISYIEATLIEMKSAADLIIRYISRFYLHIFLERKGEKLVTEELKDNKINIEFKYELNHLRRGFIHHYSGWISFKKQNNSFKPIIELPKSVKKFKDYEKFPYVSLDVEKINDILKNFYKFNDESFGFLIKKIQKLA